MSTPSFAHAARVGAFLVVVYLICIVWPFVYPYEADVLAHHLLSIKLAFPGFQGFDAGSILWGAVLSFIYGVLASFLLHTIHGGCCKGKR